MTCSSCEVIIERNLRKVSGVEKVHVSRAKEEAEIKCSDDVSIAQLQDAVKEKGYLLSVKDNLGDNAGSSANKSFILKDKQRYSEIGAVVVMIIGLYILLKQTDLLPQNLGVTDNMSYGFIFILGLVAAMSTCLAVSGGLLLAIAKSTMKKSS